MVRLAEVIRAGQAGLGGRGGSVDVGAYLIFVIFFTPTHFEAWKFYSQKCVNSQQKFARDKTA